MAHTKCSLYAAKVTIIIIYYISLILQIVRELRPQTREVTYAVLQLGSSRMRPEPRLFSLD